MDVFLNTIANSGTTGAILVVALLAIAFLYWQNQKLQTKRLDDVKQTNLTTTETLQKINNTLVAYNTTLDAMLQLLKNLDGKIKI
jgi:hypothetical protein